MKAVIQRVSNASLKVEGKLISEIRKGLVVFLGVETGDKEENAFLLAKKIANMRIFEDKNGKMNLSVTEVGGEILAVSQFTLCADCSHGNRPGFSAAEAPTRAKELYLYFSKALENLNVVTKQGVFGADMQILQANDGPVTILLQSKTE